MNSVLTSIYKYLLVTIGLLSFVFLTYQYAYAEDTSDAYLYIDAVTGEEVDTTTLQPFVDERYNDDDDDSLFVEMNEDEKFCAEQMTSKVYVDMGSLNQEVVPGDKIFFIGSIHNNYDVPIVGARIKAMIFNVQKTEAADVQDRIYLVDSLDVKNSFSLVGGDSEDVPFEWSVPLEAINGQYKVVFFVTTKNDLDFSGSMAANIGAGEMSFVVKNGREFDVNSTPYVPQPNEEVLKFVLPSIAKYPLTEGEENSIFACVQRIFNEKNDVIPNGRFVLTLKDTQGDIIASSETNISEEWTKLLKKKFVPTKTYTSFILTAELYNNGELVSSESMNYDCVALGICSADEEYQAAVSELDAGSYSSSKEQILLSVALGFIIVLVGCLLFIVFKSDLMKKRKYIFGIILGIIGLITVFFFVQKVEAAVYKYASTQSVQAVAAAGSCYSAYSGIWKPLGVHNRCVLISATNYNPYGLLALGGDGEDRRACGISGTFGGSWSVNISDEGGKHPFQCGVLCSNNSSGGTTSGPGALCKSGGKAGVMDTSGRCCTGTQLIGACGHNNYSWYSSDISCTAPDPMKCSATTIGTCNLAAATPGTVTSGSCASGYTGSCSYTCNQEANWSGGVNSCTSVVNGACGVANGSSFTSTPNSGLCAAGTASAVSGASHGPYTWTCNGLNGGTNASCSSVAASPTVTFNSNPSMVDFGDQVSLEWTVDGATGCTGSGNTDWNGPKPFSGSNNQMLTPITSTSYALTCNGVGGQTTNTVTVGINVPSVSITAEPTIIGLTDSSVIKWTVDGATSCVASGGWSGIKNSANGIHTESVSPSFSTSYTLTCTNPGGSNSETVTVTLPSGNISASPYPCTILAGQTSCTSNVVWNSYNFLGDTIIEQQSVGEISKDIVNQSAPGMSVNVNPGSDTLTLKDSRSLFEKSISATSVCANNSGWADEIVGCLPFPVISISSSLGLIRSGEVGTGIISVEANYDVDCDIIGALPSNFNHSASPSSSDYTFQTLPLTSAQTIRVECNSNAFPTISNYAEIKIGVIPSVEEV